MNKIVIALIVAAVLAGGISLIVVLTGSSDEPELTTTQLVTEPELATTQSVTEPELTTTQLLTEPVPKIPRWTSVWIDLEGGRFYDNYLYYDWTNIDAALFFGEMDKKYIDFIHSKNTEVHATVGFGDIKTLNK